MNRRSLAGLVILFVLWLSPANAQQRYIVRSTGGLNLLGNVCHFLGCSVVRSLDDPASQVFLLTNQSFLSPIWFLLALLHQPGITGAEIDLPVSVLNNAHSAPSGLLDTTPVPLNGAMVWDGYANQPAAFDVRLDDAQRAFHAQGTGIVGVIDTGVDTNHPALINVLIPGYDFTRNQAGGSETADLQRYQSTAAVVDGDSPIQVNTWGLAAVSPSTAAMIDNPQYAAFGHGTMVTGIIHLVAPAALIMPLKAFGADGTGYTSDIIRAVYWSLHSGVRILNMSFSLSGYSNELKIALNAATNQDVVCVAAAGNNSSTALVYPAALPNVMGVASTDASDHRSSFSNYGNQLVWVAAPGEGIISTYPFASYAAGWGTSFSAPFVTGTAALLLQLQPGLNETNAAQAIAHAKPIGAGMGNGRLDIFQALQSLRPGNR